MCEPTTSYPCSSSRHAATEESTPPDIATSTDPFDDMREMLRGACSDVAAGILGPTATGPDQ